MAVRPCNALLPQLQQAPAAPLLGSAAAAAHAAHAHGPPLLRFNAPMPRLVVVCQSAKKNKGFGGGTKVARDEEDGDTSPQARRMKRRNTKMSLQEQQEASRLAEFRAAQRAVAAEREAEGGEDEFAQRLRQLKAEGQERRKQGGGPQGGGQSDILRQPVAAFDRGPEEDIYANPPSLGDTLMGQLNADVSDPQLRSAQLGPNQVAVAGGAVLFGLIFVLVSGADFAPSSRFKGVRPAQDAPDSVEQGLLRGAISQLEQDLAADPTDIQASEQLALTHARLQEYDIAASILEKVVGRVPNDADVWRLLGETSLLSEKSQRAVSAYRKASALRDNDMQIATGLTDALIANGMQAKAVEYLFTLRARAPPVSAWGVRAMDAAPSTAAPAAGGGSSTSGAGVGAVGGASGQDSSSTTTNNNNSAGSSSSTAQAAPSASSGQGGGGSTSSGGASTSGMAAKPGSKGGRPPIRPLEPVSVELLLAKTYSAWRGHDTDALATYDALIARFPEDFRGYLAKGVYLRDKGRRADAERMFLQARFYAPENRQMFVKQEAETRPVIDLPGSD